MPFVYIAVMVVAFAIDRLTKVWAAGALIEQHGGSMPLIEGVFNFTYCENRGAAFSILQGQTWLLVGVTSLICLAGIYFLFFSRRKFPVFPSIAVAIVLGGALGNLYDRVVLGYVIDMLDFCLINFAVFNAADSFVNIGVALFAVWILFFEEKDKKLNNYRWGAPKAELAAATKEESDHAENSADRNP